MYINRMIAQQHNELLIKKILANRNESVQSDKTLSNSQNEAFKSYSSSIINGNYSQNGNLEETPKSVNHGLRNESMDNQTRIDLSESGQDWDTIDKAADILAQRIVENGGVDGLIKGLLEDEALGLKGNAMTGKLIVLEAAFRSEIPLKAKEIGQALEDKGIKMGEDEAYHIAVNKTGNIAVSGEDTEKALKIEEILNNTNAMARGLQRLTLSFSGRYFQARNSWHEFTSEEWLRSKTNGEVSLVDLSVQNGKIIGLPEELDELINLTKPNMTQYEKDVYTAKRNVMEKILNTGIHNIPDLTSDMVYKNGELLVDQKEAPKKWRTRLGV